MAVTPQPVEQAEPRATRECEGTARRWRSDNAGVLHEVSATAERRQEAAGS